MSLVVSKDGFLSMDTVDGTNFLVERKSGERDVTKTR